MSAILILAPDADDVDAYDSGWGDAFDQALMEVVRTLDRDGVGPRVLTPWTDDLAPLLAVALLDGAPSFDPEEGARRSERRSRILPYLAPDAALSEAEETSIFWRASHVSLSGGSPAPITELLLSYPLDAIIALGMPSWGDGLLREHLRADTRIFVFPNLVSPSLAADYFGVESDRTVSLEAPNSEAPTGAGDRSETSEPDPEAELERFVPYGLLLQRIIVDESAV